MKLDLFTLAYIECALWSSVQDDSEADGITDEHSVNDLSEETLQAMIDDCSKFSQANYDLIESNLERAGHDFWLTRNRHGAGFWDGDWNEDAGKLLTDASHAYGEVSLYVGDNGKIYHM